MSENLPTGTEARVCADIASRQQLGIAKYGCTVEQSPDDMLTHAYQEALDLAVYLKAEIERRDTPPAERSTPETDEVLRRNAESDQTPEEDYEVLADHAANLEYRLAERTEQRDTLQRWKDEALAVESWWKKIDDAIRAHPDAIIGQVVADTALRFIRERDEFADLLREANDHVHECPLKARIRMALSATKGGKS